MTAGNVEVINLQDDVRVRLLKHAGDEACADFCKTDRVAGKSAKLRSCNKKAICLLGALLLLGAFVLLYSDYVQLPPLTLSDAQIFYAKFAKVAPAVFVEPKAETSETPSPGQTESMSATTLKPSTPTESRLFSVPQPPDEIPTELKWYPVPWDATKQDKWRVEVLAAYYDYRLAKVLVLLASDAAALLEGQPTGAPFEFSCLFFYAGSPVVSETAAHFHTSYMLYCPLPNNRRYSAAPAGLLVPSALTVLRNDSRDAIHLWRVPVVDLQRRRTDRYSNGSDSARTLALCVGIMYGFQPWLTVLQYIEFHRWQGVQKFYFFYSDIHQSMKEIFAFYEKTFPGLIVPVYWMPSHYTCDPNYRCQILRDNFCSYSLMHKYRFVGGSDYDELFFPANADQESLAALLQRLDRPERGSFTFRAKYHQRLRNDTPPWENLRAGNYEQIVAHFLPLAHFSNVSSPAGHFYSPKSITKPETVVKRWIHFVHTHIRGTAIYHPEEAEASLRHFKVRSWWGDWAAQADQEVRYALKDPLSEIGNLTLSAVGARVARVVRLCKEMTRSF